jgi:hypothetical protein
MLQLLDREYGRRKDGGLGVRLQAKQFQHRESTQVFHRTHSSPLPEDDKAPSGAAAPAPTSSAIARLQGVTEAAT